MFGDGIFGGLFDFDGDGSLDGFERAAELTAFDMLMDGSDEENAIEEQGLYQELEVAGLDIDELRFMDEDERREAIEDVGLDPDAYDFD